MENFIPGLTPQDFFEVYKVLVKTELLENKSLVSGSEILERFTQDLMIFLDESPEYQIKGEDSIFPEPCSEDRCNNVINKTPQSMVEFLELKDIYEKVQSRAGGGSHQRVASGLINIKATSEGQLCGMNVFVQRMPEAAALCGDVNGRIPLEVNHEDYFKNQQLFSVDLDSVYNTPNGTPVYKLATVDAERRNLFQLIVSLKLIDGTESGPFMSKPFLIRSRKPGSRSNSFEIS
ncbi:Hypothetical predicted protein [Paramuricea clavata]|uniref:Uncharacterized protein n=1 Tax=Paramuricea clavata TaxID=317549 RepID=A0A6S7IKW7_PARCT|nr:Hypothetical predicted protein [Paramuricea clavata]